MRKEYKIFFVVLHYETINDTIKCISSIEENCKNYNIVIVDNGSTNRSGIELIKKYSDNKFIEVLLLDTNLGFANGNNIGYRYAKKNGADFIIQINSDIEFIEKDFIQNIIKYYEKDKFAVLGPCIYNPNKKVNQNPMNWLESEKIKVFFRILKNIFGLLLNIVNIDGLIKHENKNNYNIKKELVLNDTKFTLHGSCLVFSPIYVENVDGMFNKTYMYYEEDILGYLCRKNNLKMLYVPQIKVIHYGGSSTNVLNKNKKKTIRKFKYKHSINSLIEYYLLINSNTL